MFCRSDDDYLLQDGGIHLPYCLSVRQLVAGSGDNPGTPSQTLPAGRPLTRIHRRTPMDGVRTAEEG